MNYIMGDYDAALEKILTKGIRTGNRTGIDTLSIFGMRTRYFINEKFPLLTGRKVWPKSIFAELLWIMSGSTNVKDLQALGSRIWDKWDDPDFQKQNGYVAGSLGPVYGFQLRHFGGYFGDGDQDNARYGEGGFDQLFHMIRMVEREPESRRNLFTLWNPTQIGFCKLPPCHYTFQLMCEGNRLSGILTQRSADYPIGVPANVQFYSALIYLIAKKYRLEPWEFIHTTADSHIYVNQIDSVKQYLNRPKLPSPELKIGDIDLLAYEHSIKDLESFDLIDYNPLEKIEIPVTV